MTYNGLNDWSAMNMDATIFLALIEKFSQLYNQASSSAKYRIVFMLHESGSLLNFQGVKKFLDVNLEETSIQNPEFVLCLDSLAEALEGGVYVHVSKLPNKIGPIAKFIDILTRKAAVHGEDSFIEVVQKKINLADTFSKWAHERFSMRRMPAFTLSSVKTHSSPLRTTIFNEPTPAMDRNIQVKTKILAEALATYIFQRNDDEEINEVFPPTIKSLRPYMQPQSLLKGNNILKTFEKYLKNVKVITEKPDAREPDFMFFDGEEATLNVYK